MARKFISGANLPELCWLGLLLFALLGLVFQSQNPHLNWDSALYLQTGQLILRGQIPYRDFWELNPPLIMYLNVLPAYLSEHLGLAVPLALLLSLGGFSLAAFALASESGYARIASRRLALAVVFVLMLWRPLLFRQFGQKEQLFGIAFVPYLLLRWFPPARRAWVTWVALFLCSLMGCLRPNFILLILTSEAILVSQRSGLSRKSLGALALPPVLYGLLFASFPLAVTKEFFFDHVPFVLHRYGSVADEWAWVFFVWKFYFLAVPLTCALLFRRGRDAGREALFRRSLSFLTLLSFALAVAEKKSWGHHILVPDALLCFGVAILLDATSERTRETHRWGGALAALVVLVAGAAQFSPLFGANHMMESYYSRQELRSKDLNAILDRAGPGERVAIFACEPTTIYPALLEHRQWPGTRYTTMFPLCLFNRSPARQLSLAHGYPAFAELEPEEKIFVGRLREDLLLLQPSLLVFPLRNAVFLPPWFSVFSYAQSVGLYDAIKERYEVVYENSDWLALKIKQPGPPSGAPIANVRSPKR